jgi:hypothetical protein
MPDIVLDDAPDRIDRRAAVHQEKRRRSKQDFAPRVRRKVASEYLDEVYGLRVAEATLAKKAVVGGGPVFHRFGPWPYYDTDELDRWAAEKLGRTLHSTSEAAAEPDAVSSTTLPILQRLDKFGIDPEERAVIVRLAEKYPGIFEIG